MRLRAVMACALADVAKVTQLAERLAQETELPEPRRLGLLRLAERCAGRRVGDDWPETREAAKSSRAPASSHAGKAEASAAPPPGGLPWNSPEFTCPQGMTKVPGATFWMGSKRGYNSEDETPRYQTKLRGFCLDLTEVTVADYSNCVRGGACTRAAVDSTTCNYRHEDRGLHPINCVNYAQAEAFCAHRKARLPTEVEWEFAARGGALALKYPWGDGSPDGRACWKHHMTCPVKTFAAGAFGLFDMTGNVWEWTSSEYAPYPFPGRPEESPQKVYRGGSWSRRFEKWMHVGLRNRWGRHEHGSHLGFRCARTVEGLTCPEGADAQGQCLPVVLAAECPALQVWNGYRCAAPNAPACEEGRHTDPRHGCVRDVPLVIRDHVLDTRAVHRQRSPEFDGDCRKNQPKRPQSYRYFGSEHEARNLVAKQAGCKNRDVGAGWNSTCCP
jgi:formylglycine-generating enzyme required for sulfatase activity